MISIDSLGFPHFVLRDFRGFIASQEVQVLCGPQALDQHLDRLPPADPREPRRPLPLYDASEHDVHPLRDIVIYRIYTYVM